MPDILQMPVITTLPVVLKQDNLRVWGQPGSEKRKKTKNMISSGLLPASSEVTFKKLKDKFYSTEGHCPQPWIWHIISLILLKVPGLFI